MTPNALGNFIRERRMDLGLTQEALAERIGPTVRQAEISRLERGQVTMPHRKRMEQIAAALDVSLGTLLHCSGWLTHDEREEVDAGDALEWSEPELATRRELSELRETLKMAIDRLADMERRVLAEPSMGGRSQAW